MKYAMAFPVSTVAVLAGPIRTRDKLGRHSRKELAMPYRRYSATRSLQRQHAPPARSTPLHRLLERYEPELACIAVQLGFVGMLLVIAPLSALAVGGLIALADLIVMIMGQPH
jgi:hypothetical protein